MSHHPLGEHAPRSTSFESYSTTFKCIVGSGLMSLPFAFAQSGWLVGTLCMIVVGGFSFSTMAAMIDAVHLTRTRLRRRKKAKIAHSRSIKSFQALEEAARQSSDDAQQLQQPKPTRPASSLSVDYGSNGSLDQQANPSPGPDPLDPLDLSIIKADPDADVIGYQQVAYCAYGNVGRILTDTVLIFCQVGSCAAFLILILGNVQAVLASFGWHIPQEPIAVALLPIIIMLAIPRSTTFLAGAAHFGNFTMLTALGTIIYFGLTDETSNLGRDVHDEGVGGVMDNMSQLAAYSGSLEGVSVFFGISAFSFAAHCEVVAVEADAESREEYATVLARTMTAIVSLYIFVGVFAFACFNSATQPNIMLNLGSEIFVNVVRVAVSCTLLVNVAMALLPASQTLDLIIIGAAPLSTELPHQIEPSDTLNDERTSLLNGRRSEPSSPETLMNGHASSTHGGWPAAIVRINTPALDAAEAESQASLEQKQKIYRRKGNYIRISSVLGFVIFALLVRNLSVVFSLVGSIAGGIICFSAPPLFAWRMARLEKVRMSWARQAWIFVQIAFGIVLIALGLQVIAEGDG